MARDGAHSEGGFVGRTAELQAMRDELEVATSGLPRLVVVEGAPGVGKSRLVRELLRGVGNLHVVEASGDEAESHLAFGVVHQLFASVRGLPGAAGPPLDRPGAALDPLAAGTALLRLVAALEESGPVVMVLDDAQWADPQSLQALSFTLRRLHADQVLAIVAAREARVDLPEGMRRMAGAKGRLLRLGSLSLEELSDLATSLGAPALPRRALNRLWEHTGGNPLHARGLLEELPAEALLGEGPLPAPRSYALLVLARLASCSPPARRLVEAVSVLGSNADLSLACRLADVGEPAGALDEALGAGLLEVRDAPTTVVVRFPHALVRAAVYDNLGRGRRSQLHARAGELLPATASLEHRAAAALVQDADLAAELARRAGQEMARGEAVAAARHLLAAARLSPDAKVGERRLLDAVDLLLAGGEVREATTLTSQVAALPDTPRKAYVLGHLAFLSGNQKEAEELLVSAWRRAEQDAEAEVAVLASQQLAELCALQVRPEETVRWARRAAEREAGVQLGSPALATLVIYLALVGRPGEALPLVEHLPSDLVKPTARELSGLLGRGVVRTWIADLEGARADLIAVVHAADRFLASTTGLRALGFLSHVEYLTAEWVHSVRHAELAVDLAADLGQRWLLAFLHASASWALSAQGRWEAAEAHVAQAREAAGAVGDAVSLAYAEDAEARLAWFRGDLERLVGAGRRLSALPGRAVVDEPAVFAWQELYAEGLIGLGRLEEARAVLSPLEDKLGSRPRRRLAWAGARRVRANLRAAEGDEAGAVDAFVAALSCPEISSAPFELALAEEAYGRFLRRVGQRDEATARLQSARDSFARLGSRPLLERAERELAACGLTPRRRPALPQVELTPQELAVAELVTRGHTNREVAETLVISVKTVEYHLAHVFTKLGVTSRRQLRLRMAQRL